MELPNFGYSDEMERLQTTPLPFEKLDDKPSVAMVRLVLAAEETTLIDNALCDGGVDAASLHEIKKFALVHRPSPTVLLVGVENLLCRSQLRYVDVVHSTDLPEEELQIVTFAEARELTGVVEAHIDHTSSARLADQIEESTRWLLSETDGEYLHG
jgi:hypothetical protein